MGRRFPPGNDLEDYCRHQVDQARWVSRIGSIMQEDRIRTIVGVGQSAELRQR